MAKSKKEKDAPEVEPPSIETVVEQTTPAPAEEGHVAAADKLLPDPFNPKH